MPSSTMAQKRKMWTEALLDSGATSHFNTPSDGLPLTGPSLKTIAATNSALCKTTNTAQLPMTQL